MEWIRLILAATTALLYLAATISYLYQLLRFHHRSHLPLFISFAAAFFHIALLITTALSGGYRALFSMAGAVTAGGTFLVFTFLWMTKRFDLRGLGSMVMPIAGLSVVPSLFSFGAPKVATPILDSILAIHILSAILGTVAFVFAFILSILYLILQKRLKQKRFPPWLQRLPSLEKLDTFSLCVAIGGFIIYTFSIFLAVLWSWQHLALFINARNLLTTLTWAVYALMIQGRITAGWQGRKAALLTIAGTFSALGVVVIYLIRG